jgi:hypothetical protein
MRRRFIALPAAMALAVLGVTAWIAGAAGAATPACTAVPGPVCGSWNAEVPGLPDLDVFHGAAFSGNGLIMFTRTSSDRAEDFTVQVVPAGSTSTYPGVHAAVAPAGAVRIEYTPFGVATDLYVSTVNPNGLTAVQLRHGDDVPGTYNPFQTFVQASAACDGTCFTFAEVIHGMLLTDPRNGGSTGVVGHRVHVLVKPADGTSGQLWGQNGT